MTDIAMAPRRYQRWRIFIAPVLCCWQRSPGAGSGILPPRRWTRRPMHGVRARPGRAASSIAQALGWGLSVPPRGDLRGSQRRTGVADRSQPPAQPFTAKLGQILVVAQIYDPKKVIAEFTAPATLFDPVMQQSYAVNWSLGHASIAGLPFNAGSRLGRVQRPRPQAHRCVGAGAGRAGETCRAARPACRGISCG